MGADKDPYEEFVVSSRRKTRAAKKQLAESLKGLVSITRHFPSSGSSSLLDLTDKEKVAAIHQYLVETLEVKDPCKCLHADSVVFHTARGDVTASVCDHCFDILGGLFKMTPELKLLLEYPAEKS